MLELAIGTALSVVFFFLGRWEGRRTERGIHARVAQVPVETASIIETVFRGVFDQGQRQESRRSWDTEYEAVVGHAGLVPKDDGPYPMELLIEFPYGAHSRELLVFAQDVDTPGIRMLGHLHNGVGAEFHTGSFTGMHEAEVATLDYIKPLDPERSFFDMPVQAVYYAWRGSRFVEVGRGPVYDRRDNEAPPESVLRFLPESYSVEPPDYEVE